MRGNSDAEPIVQAGETIAGRYRVEKEIARGGMAHVVRAEDTLLGTIVALKILPPALSSQWRSIEEIKEEARITMSLNHPNIVKLHQFESTPKYKFLVMEYIEGESLGEVVFKKGRLPLEEVLGYLSGVCSALDFAHSHGVIHRDIKPDNLLIDLNGTVKLTDFGIAQKVRKAFASITQQVIMGTVSYMSPEQLLGHRIDHRSDIYSLGATVYEFLSGCPPFLEGHIESQILLRTPQPIDGIPQSANEVVLKALYKDASRRWSSATEFYQALAGEIERIEAMPDSELQWPEHRAVSETPKRGDLRILAVDDEEDIRTTVQAIMSGSGYQIVTAFDGEDALEQLAKDSYDLLITDIYMPRMDGIRLLCRIRNEGSGIPVIMLTALDQEKYVLRSYRSGADYYMVKPFAKKRLIAAARYLMGDFSEDEREDLEHML